MGGIRHSSGHVAWGGCNRDGGKEKTEERKGEGKGEGREGRRRTPPVIPVCCNSSTQPGELHLQWPPRDHDLGGLLEIALLVTLDRCSRGGLQWQYIKYLRRP